MPSLFTPPPKKKFYRQQQKQTNKQKNPDKEFTAERIKAASVLNVPEPPFSLLHFCRWAPYISWNKRIGGALVQGRAALITELSLAAEHRQKKKKRKAKQKEKLISAAAPLVLMSPRLGGEETCKKKTTF